MFAVVVMDVIWLIFYGSRYVSKLMQLKAVNLYTSCKTLAFVFFDNKYNAALLQLS